MYLSTRLLSKNTQRHLRAYSSSQKSHTNVVVVGAGTAGISVSAQLLRAGVNNVTIIDPSENHFYQPGWTLVGGQLMSRADTVKKTAEVIPPGAKWVKDRVVGFNPDISQVELGDGSKVGYDILVVAAGIQINWNKIPGLMEAMGKNGVCSNYGWDTVCHTVEAVKNFKGGHAVFTQPSTPIKCAGAPQKIMYLADDYWTKKDPKMRRQIDFYSGAAGIFGCAHYAPSLNEHCKTRGLHTHFRHEIVEIRGEDKEVVFTHLDSGKETVVKFDFLHVAPPMSAPDFIKDSALAGETGFVDVDKHTLRHTKYENIFALGDASNLPTSKTAAAISSQAPILVQNLLNTVEGKPLAPLYHGYTSCPIPVGGGKLIMCEFNYNMEPQETFPWDQRIPGRVAYHLKKDIIPPMYWNGTLKGIFKGPDALPWKKWKVGK